MKCGNVEKDKKMRFHEDMKVGRSVSKCHHFLGCTSAAQPHKMIIYAIFLSLLFPF